jgi:hypothetical protein
MFASLWRIGGGPRRNKTCSHVVGYVDGVKLVGEEAVPQMHPLFLSSGIDGDGAGVSDDHDPHDQVVLLQDGVGDQRHQIQSLVFGSVQFGDDNQKIRPGEDSAEKRL